MQKLTVKLVNSSDSLEVEGTSVRLEDGKVFFCARLPVKLEPDQALDIPFEDLVLAEYGYPEGISPFPFLEISEAVSESDLIFVLGWYL